jgi:phage protein D
MRWKLGAAAVSPSTLVAGLVVKVGGTDLPPELANVLNEVRVEQSLNLPDGVRLRLQDDMSMRHIDSHPFDFGKEVEVQMQAPNEDTFVKVFKGEVVSVEGEFEEGGVYLNVRGYGKGHRLNRAKKNKVWLDQSYSDIASAVGGEAQLQTQTDADPAGSRKFVQQSNETNWELLVRCAGEIGFTVTEREGKLYFTKAENPTAGGTKTLEWGKGLVAFRPRMTGVQQVDKVTVRGWNPATKKSIVGVATPGQVKLGSKIGMHRAKAAQSAFNEAEVEIGDRLVTTDGEAKALAKSVLEKQANAYLEATGKVEGRPDLKAGDWVEIKGVGSRFGGTYLLSEVVHVYTESKGFMTSFRISGQSTRGIVDAIRPVEKSQWSGSIVVGQVTNNNDPDGLGRVKVKFPTLGDQLESWWARVASPSAGKDRGLLMMPIAGDEVLVAFEHGDARRPYVIGSVWNGREKPGNLVQKDGSLVVQSDKQIQMKAKEPISVKGDKELTIETTGKISQKTSNAIALEATSDASLKAMKVAINADADITLNATATLTIKAAGKVTVDAGGMLTLKSAGVVQVSGTAIKLG